MPDGYIKLHRSLLNWEWWDDMNTFRLWIVLLLLASFRETQWHGHTILPGQLITSRASLAKISGLSEQSVRTSLNKLKSTNQITIDSTNSFSLITIVNWDKFQSDEDKSTNSSTSNSTSNQPATNQRLTSDQPHRKNDKKDKNVKKDINPLTPFEQAIEDFKAMRTKIKKPLTPRAEKMLYNELENLAPGDEELKIKILEQSIFNCWQGVLPLKEKPSYTYSSDSRPYRCAVFLDEQLCERLKERKPADEETKQLWAAEFDSVNKSGYSWKLIAWLLENALDKEYWQKVLISGTDFKRHFEKLYSDFGDPE